MFAHYVMDYYSWDKFLTLQGNDVSRQYICIDIETFVSKMLLKRGIKWNKLFLTCVNYNMWQKRISHILVGYKYYPKSLGSGDRKHNLLNKIQISNKKPWVILYVFTNTITMNLKLTWNHNTCINILRYKLTWKSCEAKHHTLPIKWPCFDKSHDRRFE